MDKAPDAFRTISEVADELDIPQHVLRFWETRFSQIRPMKRGGGRRYYRPDDVDLLRGIRHLLYGQGYTIRGVQRILREQGVRFVQSVWQAGAVQPAHRPEDEEEDAAVVEAAPNRRGLLGSLLPGRSDSQAAAEAVPAPDRSEPPTPAASTGPAPETGSGEREAPAIRAASAAPPAAGPAAGLSREDLRKLQASLYELQECRRLLDSALAESS